MSNRVLHIDSGLEWRGGQRQLYLLALEQRARGLEPLVVGQPRSKLVTQLRRIGVASSGVRMRGVWDLAAVRKIRRLVRTWKADTVHVHDARALTLAHSALVGLPKVALVVTCRTSLPRPGALRRSADRVSRFIAPNGDVADFLGRLGIARERVDVVPPGVPRYANVHARDWRREGRWPNAVVVCGIMGLSGSGALTRLRAILAGVSKEVRACLRLVALGGVPVGEMKVGGVETFGAGFVDDIPSAIAGCDLFCNLSGAESMGTTSLDAMALGVPAIAFDEGGGKEYIEDGRSGIVVRLGEQVAFARALSSLIEDEQLRHTLSAFGPGRASRFSTSRMADGVERTYALAGPGSTVSAGSAKG